jgi:hypothetical protein
MRLATLLISILLATSLPVSAAVPTADPDAAAEAEIKALELHLAKLLVSREFDEYERYLAADYTRINANGVVETREQVLAGFRASTGEFSMQPTDLVVNIYGDTAILTGTLTVATAQSSRVSRFRKVFIRRDGRWFLVSLQGVTLPRQ